MSGESPFASCVTTTYNDSVTVGTEESPVLAANPVRPRNLVAVWAADRWSSAGSHGAVAGYSNDGGRSWSQAPLPFSTCAPGGGPYARALLPAVSFGGDGTAYAVSGSYEAPGPYPRSVVAAVSMDGGRSWRTMRHLADYAQGGGGLRLSVTGDPRRPGWAYAAWQVFTPSPAGGQHSTGYISRTTDFGASWSTPQAFTGLGSTSAYNNRLLADRRSGRLVVTYQGCVDPCDASSLRIAYRTSRDRGVSWSAERTISDQQVADITTVSLPQPGTGDGVDTLWPPTSAISTRGRIAVAWEDSRFSAGRTNHIAVSVSNDGRHWTAPHRADDTPDSAAAVLPAVAVSRRGTVAVTYYDARRDNPADAPFSVDFWGTTSHSGTRFLRSSHLGGSFDALGASTNGQHLTLGTSTGLVATRGRFVSVFLRSTCAARPCPVDNPSELVAAAFHGPAYRS